MFWVKSCKHTSVLPIYQKNVSFSKRSLVFASTLAALLLMSVVSAAGPISNNQIASAGTFPGVNGKVAFASNRDGNFEIYVMNADGGHHGTG
jgi:Tol biopolymer transport system component